MTIHPLTSGYDRKIYTTIKVLGRSLVYELQIRTYLPQTKGSKILIALYLNSYLIHKEEPGLKGGGEGLE